MVCVAANDGYLAVMARRMRDIHPSVMMFWFSSIGTTILSVGLLLSGIFTMSVPTVFTYNPSQYYNLVLPGIMSSLNLTCLTIAY